MPSGGCFIYILIFSPNIPVSFYNLFFIMLLFCPPPSFYFIFFCTRWLPGSVYGMEIGPELLWWELLGLVSPSLNCWTNRECQAPGNINQSEVSQRSTSQYQDLALPSLLQTPLLETSVRTTSKTGTQSHSSRNETTINMLQIKEQGKHIQDQINENGIGNLSEKELNIKNVLSFFFKNDSKRCSKILKVECRKCKKHLTRIRKN